MEVKPIRIPPHAIVTVLTGAGVSAESGIATFRDANGLWERHDPRTLATPEAFARDPDLVWRFYSARRKQALECRPNPAHLALAALKRRLGRRMTLITQNVDGLHQRAGSQCLPIHGSLFRTRCTNPDCAGAVAWEDRGIYMDGMPACGPCGSPLRPDIVWFGERLDRALAAQAAAAVSACDIFIAAGTSGVVAPAADYAMCAKANGARTILVNLGDAANADMFDEVIVGRAGEILPGLLAA